jgi:hypothetical protein
MLPSQKKVEKVGGHLVYDIQKGSGAKNLALLQNQCKPLQLGKLINLITWKMVHEGKNYSIKLRKYYFCTTTNISEILKPNHKRM